MTSIDGLNSPQTPLSPQEQGEHEADKTVDAAQISFDTLVKEVDDPSVHLILALEGTGALVGLYDHEDRLRMANRAFRDAFFIADETTPTWEEMIRTNFAHNRGTVLNSVKTNSDLDAWIRSVKSRRGKIKHRTFETDLMDGRWVLSTETVQSNGWMLYISIDITELRRSERDLRQDRDFALKASQTDDLTGISNRRHIMAHLDDLLAGRSAFGPMPGCSCLLDIDHFKLINDRLGHQVGDRVLMRFADLVRAELRPKDSFGRVGGEEFMLNFPATTTQDALALMDRLFTTLRGARIVPNMPDQVVTCSAGFSRFEHGETSATVYRRCDQALYEAKNKGRDQLRIGRY